MTVYPYLEKTAINPVAPITIAKSATFSVYDSNDSGFITPLNCTRLSDGVTVTTLLSDSNGYIPDFTVIDRTSVVIHDSSSGFSKTLVTSAPVPGPGDASYWKPSTNYAAGQRIILPSGDVGTAIAAFTSAASYDASKWTASTQDGRLAAVEAKQSLKCVRLEAGAWIWDTVAGTNYVIPDSDGSLIVRPTAQPVPVAATPALNW